MHRTSLTSRMYHKSQQYHNLSYSALLLRSVQFKFVSVNNRGVPDRIIITPVGDVLFVEFKRKGKDLFCSVLLFRILSLPLFYLHC
jgi:hypothetical protein